MRSRALWWALPDHEHPASLDCVWVHPSVPDPAAEATALVTTAQAAFAAAGQRQPADYNLDLPTTWHDEPDTMRAVEWRSRAAAAAGLTEQIERLRFTWTAETALPPRSTRLTFVPGDDDAFLAAFARVAQGSLDLNTRRDLVTMGAEGQARDDLDFYVGLPGRRDWWRLAYDADGALTGFVIPSRTAYDPSVSYLGVVPEQRGRGYVDDLLAEITHVHAAAGAERITAATDTTNAPMAAAFRRGGYEVTSIRLVMSAPPMAD